MAVAGEEVNTGSSIRSAEVWRGMMVPLTGVVSVDMEKRGQEWVFFFWR